MVADNVGIPGAPKYRAYMKEQQGEAVETIEHETHVEYQTLLKDLVLEWSSWAEPRHRKPDRPGSRQLASG